MSDLQISYEEALAIEKKTPAIAELCKTLNGGITVNRTLKCYLPDEDGEGLTKCYFWPKDLRELAQGALELADALEAQP